MIFTLHVNNYLSIFLIVTLTFKTTNFDFFIFLEISPISAYLQIYFKLQVIVNIKVLMLIVNSLLYQCFSKIMFYYTVFSDIKNII